MPDWRDSSEDDFRSFKDSRSRAQPTTSESFEALDREYLTPLQVDVDKVASKHSIQHFRLTLVILIFSISVATGIGYLMIDQRALLKQQAVQMDKISAQLGIVQNRQADTVALRDFVTEVRLGCANALERNWATAQKLCDSFTFPE